MTQPRQFIRDSADHALLAAVRLALSDCYGAQTWLTRAVDTGLYPLASEAPNPMLRNGDLRVLAVAMSQEGWSALAGGIRRFDAVLGRRFNTDMEAVDTADLEGIVKQLDYARACLAQLDDGWQFDPYPRPA